MGELDADGYAPATAHDPIEEIFPDLYLVRGSYRMNALMTFNRNMIVIRHADELVVVNSVRLSPTAEAELDSLGKVRHVMRLGYFHGVDDRYYVDRYDAEFWAPIASRANPGPAVTHTLEEQGELPVPGLKAFVFKHTRHPEAALLLERHDGVLITCDALQYYADRKFCSPFARVFMPLKGFRLRMIISPLWLKAMTPHGGNLRSDFERLQALDFKHFVAAHGSLLRDNAHSAVREAVQNTL